MPRRAAKSGGRIYLRLREKEKALLIRAAVLDGIDLCDFVIGRALLAAQAVIEQADHVQLSEKDTLRVLELLENPPAPSARLLAASEVVRAGSRTLKREKQQHEAKLAALRAAIDEGDGGGVANGDVFGRVRKALRIPAPRR